MQHWKYRMMKSPGNKYTCYVQNEQRDNICKMLQEDSPDISTQEEYAKLICAAPHLLKALRAMVTLFDRNLDESSIGRIACDDAIEAMKNIDI